MGACAVHDASDAQHDEPGSTSARLFVRVTGVWQLTRGRRGIQHVFMEPFPGQQTADQVGNLLPLLAGFS
jgi:hypothetical protein